MSSQSQSLKQSGWRSLKLWAFLTIVRLLGRFDVVQALTHGRDQNEACPNCHGESEGLVAPE